MSPLIKLIRPDLRDFIAYSSARDEAKYGKIWLNANESPYDYEYDQIPLNRYPTKQPADILQALANYYQLQPSNILLSRGSDEGIDLLVRLFCTAGRDAILICPPTFGMYSVCAKLQGAKIIEVPLQKTTGFQLDVKQIKQVWDEALKLVFLCSPNNPSGNVLAMADILDLCEYLAGKGMVVVDEAYIDFAEASTLVSAIATYPNLVILRTFSKAFGLASARIGTLLATEELVSWLLKIIAPYPLPALSCAVLWEALTAARLAEVQQHIDVIKTERAILQQRLQELACVKHVWDSSANFLLVETSNAEWVIQRCAAAGIVLRDMSNKIHLENCVRISIGTPLENQQLITVLQQIDRG